MSLLLGGGTVVRSLEPPIVERADLLVADGRVAVTPAPRLEDSDRVERLDCTDCLILPGLVCAHTHAYSALARGLAFGPGEAPGSFLEILQRVWWRLDRALDLPSIRASALVAAHEALLSGTTAVIDHHASPFAIDGSLDVIAEAFEELGLRSVLCYEVSDRDGAVRALEGIEENARFLRRVEEGRWPLARGLVGAHASFTLSDDTLAACVDLSTQARAGMHVHVAEDAADQADAVARFGTRVVDRLHRAGALTGDSLLAHAVHINAAEADLVRAAGATVAHNPRSNMNNGVGRTPIGWLPGLIALGTDGIGADMFEESRCAYLRRREEDVTTSTSLPLGLLSKGADVVGRGFGEPLLGRLQPGSPADVTVLDYGSPGPMDADSLGGHWTFGLGASRVRDVIVAGELVVRNRRSTRVDAAEIEFEARRAGARLGERLSEIGPHPFAPSLLLATDGGA